MIGLASLQFKQLSKVLLDCTVKMEQDKEIQNGKCKSDDVNKAVIDGRGFFVCDDFVDCQDIVKYPR